MSEFLERVTRRLTEHPGRPLIYRAATGGVVTAADLADLADALAARLSTHIAAGRPLLSIAGNTPVAIALLLAARRHGLPLLPVDRGASAAEVRSIVERFRPAVIVAPAALDTGNAGVREPLDDGLVLLGLEADEASAPVAPDVAVLKLTSGSTGTPRATQTTDANLLADGQAIIESMDIRPHDVQLAAIPLSHAYGLGNLVLPLLLQGTTIVVRDGFVPHQFPQDALTYGVTMFPGVPFMFDHLAEHVPGDAWPQGLTRLISAGARLDRATVLGVFDRFGRKIHSFYGTSETGGICYDDTSGIDAEPTVGRPMPRVEVTLRAEHGAPPGGGRVHVAGPAVARGYLGDAAMGEQEASPFVDGGFLTGDLGAFDEGGRLVLSGRVSSFVNVAGRKVQPQEVEAVLRAAAGVLDVRVVGAPDPLRGEQLVACVVCAGEHDGTRLRQHCAARLAPFKVPRRYLFLDAIPLTERGKTDAAGLAALISAHLSGRS